MTQSGHATNKRRRGIARASETNGSLERLRKLDPARFISKLAGSGQTKGDNMTIARTIAITAAVCAAIGMTTHAEAAKRKAAGGSRITLIGCAYTELVCGTVMNFAGNIYALSSSGYGVHPA